MWAVCCQHIDSGPFILNQNGEVFLQCYSGFAHIKLTKTFVPPMPSSLLKCVSVNSISPGPANFCFKISIDCTYMCVEIEIDDNLCVVNTLIS